MTPYKLPEPAYASQVVIAEGYSEAQMLKLRADTIEECARTCVSKHENGNYKHDTREDCEAAIRALGDVK